MTVLSDDARIMSLLDEGDSDATFTVELPANTALVADNEDFLIVGDAGGTELVLGGIKTPWAVDADHIQLATSYTFSGTPITQHVHTQGAKYPLVADPTITFGLGLPQTAGTYWNLTGTQTKSLAAATTAVFGRRVAGGCVATGKIPKVGYIVQACAGSSGAESAVEVVRHDAYPGEYEHGQLVVLSNKDPAHWPEILQDRPSSVLHAIVSKYRSRRSLPILTYSFSLSTRIVLDISVMHRLVNSPIDTCMSHAGVSSLRFHECLSAPVLDGTQI